MMDPVTPLLVKWITHDLATPIATVLTASELLSDKADPEINGLVQDGAARLANRLKLIRAALSPADSPTSAAALARLLRAGTDGTPLDWQHPDGDIDGHAAAIIAGAVMLLADLRRGQPIAITASGAQWATPAPLPESVVASIGGAPPVDSRSALAAMLAAAAKRSGATLSIVPDGLAWR